MLPSEFRVSNELRTFLFHGRLGNPSGGPQSKKRSRRPLVHSRRYGARGSRKLRTSSSLNANKTSSMVNLISVQRHKSGDKPRRRWSTVMTIGD